MGQPAPVARVVRSLRLTSATNHRATVEGRCVASAPKLIWTTPLKGKDRPPPPLGGGTGLVVTRHFRPLVCRPLAVQRASSADRTSTQRAAASPTLRRSWGTIAGMSAACPVDSRPVRHPGSPRRFPPASGGSPRHCSRACRGSTRAQSQRRQPQSLRYRRRRRTEGSPGCASPNRARSRHRAGRGSRGRRPHVGPSSRDGCWRGGNYSLGGANISSWMLSGSRKTRTDP